MEGRAAARRAYHDEIMSAGGGYLHGPLDVLLPLHLGEIVVEFGLFLVELLAGVHPRGLQLAFLVEEVHHLGQRTCAQHVEAVHHGGLAGVLRGDDDALEAHLARLDGYGQGALDGLKAAVEAQLAHEHVAREPLRAHHAHRRQDAYGHGQVVGRTLLADVGRSQIDDQLLRGELVPVDLDGGHDALVAFLYCGVGQAHKEELHSARVCHLYRDGDGVDALHGRRKQFD